MAQTYRIEIAPLASDLARHLAQVRYRGVRKIVTHGGVPSGALISMRDLARLEALEAAEAQAEARARAARLKGQPDPRPHPPQTGPYI